jgi:outer membrane protein assembly factor BamB
VTVRPILSTLDATVSEAKLHRHFGSKGTLFVFSGLPGNRSMRHHVSASLLILTVLAPAAVAGDWTQWRGPSHNNEAEPGQNVPAEWNESKNVVWRADVPGRGHASPTITGNLVVLSTADDARQTQGVVAFDRQTGKQLWITPISQGGFPTLHPKNTHASPTVATDGTQLFATFCHHEKVEAVALDLKGKIVWRKDVGGFRPKQYEYGYAASPTIYRDTLIVSADCDTVAWVKALKLADGKTAWEQQRPRMLNWSSPIVANIAGREQLLLSGLEKIASYDPATGKPLWETKCLTMATCGTCIWEGDLIFASGGYPDSQTVAVKADGSGIAWSNQVKCYEQSMLVHNGFLFAFSDSGVLYCWEAKTGKEMWKQRLRGPVSSSPLLVGDTIFATNESGTTWAFRASGKQYEPLAQNQLGDSGFASMAAVDGQLFIRTAKGDGVARKESLYCIGKK